ncbi:bis(5'-nucleosyl)-tetraphosphatase [Lentilactobacillus sp. SPB1-3]|uniref:Bis(5'-nucleosyl)-tetraphosphatase n=1 Tax=Lentilactobacillus terminaliae TaxID=3003483 RepID=A0ACD5DFX9_9LACO|nr:NUDIX domain-containing protein [Lentilactobacillus sp. SPB1-3]MCZ0976650.1 NUDIX domain-containing protein [Lentilactobacillus sp. SPB1-3]
MPTENDSGAIVYQIRNNMVCYLLLQSAVDDFWGFPKGHIEAGEDLIDTAVREIFEETSLTTTIDTGFQQSIEYDMKNGNHKVVNFFVSRVPANVEVSEQEEEINSFGWFTFDRAYETVTYDNLRELLTAADKYIKAKEKVGDKNE